MKKMFTRKNFWGWFGAFCFLMVLFLALFPGIPDQEHVRHRLYGFLGILGATAIGFLTADFLGLLPRAVPRKCPKCGKKLTTFTKNYATGEVTCKKCGESFFVKKGRVVSR